MSFREEKIPITVKKNIQCISSITDKLKLKIIISEKRE